MSIDKETARRAAHLARIAVPEEELENLAQELLVLLGLWSSYWRLM
jgi:aspartyl-tRNA(Asn)/glutamyl-tRNA(Gln) amidotransferase subunit C